MYFHYKTNLIVVLVLTSMFLLETDQNKNNLFMISAQERLGVVAKQKQISKNELKNSGISDIKNPISRVSSFYSSLCQNLRKM